MNIFTAAERLAAARNLSPEEFLAQTEAAIEDSSYPSPDCLLPAEVSHYHNYGRWPPEAASEIALHLESCVACKTLLEASAPDCTRRQEFVQLASSSSFR